jgi:hypothetical protein
MWILSPDFNVQQARDARGNDATFRTTQRSGGDVETTPDRRMKIVLRTASD